jgi:hypothetical protein
MEGETNNDPWETLSSGEKYSKRIEHLKKYMSDVDARLAEQTKLDNQEEQRKKKFLKEAAKKMQDTSIDFIVRNNDYVTGSETFKTRFNLLWTPSDFDCPEMFGPFKVSKWGGVGGCGFDIWFDENGKREKRWIDLHTILNFVKAVKMKNFMGIDVDDTERKKILDNLKENNRGPECLIKLFPDGYYVSQDATEKASAPVAAPLEVAPEAPVEVAPAAPVEVAPVAPVEAPVEAPVAPVAANAGGAYRKRTRNIKNKSNKRKTKKINKKKTKKTRKTRKINKKKTKKVNKSKK